MDDEEKIGIVRTLSSMAMDAELNSTEVHFFEYLREFFESQAKKHHQAGYTQALKDMGVIQDG